MRTWRSCVAAAATLLGSAASAQSLTAADFAALPAMESPSLSPNGQRIAFITSTETGSAVLIANLADMTLTHTINDSEGRPRGLTWASDDSIVYVTGFSSTLPGVPGRFENPQPVGIDISGRLQITPLLREQRRTERGGGGRVATAAGGYIFINGVQFIGFDRATGRVLMPKFTQDQGRVLFSVDPRTDNQREVDEGTFNTIDWIVDENGEPLYRAEYTDLLNHFRILEHTGSTWNVMVSETVEVPELDLYGLDSNGELVVGYRPEDTGRYGLYIMDLSGQIGQPLLANSQGDVGGVRIDPYTNRVLGGALSDDEPVWFDDEMAQQQQLLDEAFPGERPTIISWSQDRSRFIVGTNNENRPPVYYLYDARALSADIIASAYPQLDNAALPNREFYSYAARDGAQIPAFLTRPTNAAGPAPLVLLPHGGPEAYDASGFDYLAHFLASRGYVVLQPQFRGSSGYGAEWRDAGRGQWGTGVMQHDVTDGIAALAAAGIADPSRVCIVGGSYGGYSALAGAVFTPELYRCAAAIAPVTDLNDMMNAERDRRGRESWVVSYWREVIGGGDVSDFRDRLAAISPAQHAANAQAAVLLIHGRNDSVVPISQSRDMADALRDAGKTVELIELQGEDHWLSQPETRLQTLQALDTFLAQHLR